MVYFVCVLSLFTILLIRFILQNLNAFSASCLIFAGFSNRIQLSYLILREREERRKRSQNRGTTAVTNSEIIY